MEMSDEESGSSVKTEAERPVSSYYKIEKGKLKRLLPFCERCGPGYFMADHGDRYSCGHCGLTKYKQRANE